MSTALNIPWAAVLIVSVGCRAAEAPSACPLPQEVVANVTVSPSGRRIAFARALTPAGDPFDTHVHLRILLLPSGGVLDTGAE